MSTRTVAINTSAPREGLVAMPSYTIQEDAPWMPRSRDRLSAAPSSVYSSSSGEPAGEASPRSLKQQPSQPSYTASCYAHNQQEITDAGPQSKRQSRLPIFKQVRTMLSNKPTRWDEMSGEPSETGKPSHVKPTNYVSPWEGAFQARRRSPDRKTVKSKKSISPVSILRDDERNTGPPRSAGGNTSRSVSPVSTLRSSLAPSQISVNTLPSPLNVKKQVKRKPVRDSLSPSASENFAPSDLRSVGSHESIGDFADNRFSWSTVAPSITGKRDAAANPPTRSPKEASSSRFSWSTVATNTTSFTHREDAEPPSPPPAIPSKYLQPPPQNTPTPAPMQSILNRKRPVQPRDRETSPNIPPVRTYASSSEDTSRATTPTARTSSLRAPTAHSPPKSSPANNKALPLPPFMTSEQATHIENLESQETNLFMQRRNVMRTIADLESKEKASPMEVSFSAVRDARRQLEEQRAVLSEIRREEMDLGIKIARARRKEDFGEGEGTLWVRRVTG